ncbi:uncharacterized protein Dana_GF18601 [Drosophila ananassae]|uniref:Uncharacterized protein n=2 Tax=Drosophila ananassae TaxID=7217 RepID=B3LVC7_DROAN|nr:uncharacterized protein Dana_GF18601 [Drosophila ananassae]
MFSDCEIIPPGFVTEDKFLDRSKLTFKRGGDGLITVSGNATFVWDIQSSDRIELDLSLWKFERGKWKPTPYNSIVKDFCKVLHDKNQPHYSYTIAHVLNKDYTKDRCFTPGTTYEFEPYKVKIAMGMAPIAPGHAFIAL